MNTSIKLQKWGNSQGIRIPKSFLNSLDINLNDEIEIILNDNEIVLKKVVNTKKTLKDLFKNYTGDYKKDFKEVEYFGEAKGNEYKW